MTRLRRGAQVTIRLASPSEKARLDTLEESLAAEGVHFDTGHDLEHDVRDWELDESLEGPLSPREIITRLKAAGFRFSVHRRPLQPPGPRLNYSVGDVFRVPLSPRQFGYGRVLVKSPPTILAEFYKIAAEQDPPLDAFGDMEVVVCIYTLDAAIAEDRTWDVIGNLPMEGEAPRPLFWAKDALSGKLYLFDEPVFRGRGKPTTMAEIEQLRAQRGGLYANPAAEKELRRKLEDAGVWGGPSWPAPRQW